MNHSELGYVMDAIKATKEKLNDEIPLIGFAGSPWTILCYVVQGQGSKNFDKAKGVLFYKSYCSSSIITKNYRYNYSLLKSKSNVWCKRCSGF